VHTGQTLDYLRALQHTKHLTLEVDRGVAWLLFNPGIFFLNLRDAIDATGLLSRGSRLTPLARRSFAFSLADLQSALR
jgi:hypothetical protein